MFLAFYWFTSWRKIHNLVKFRTKSFYHLDIGKLFSLKNKRVQTRDSFVDSVNILSNFIYITIGRLIKSLF